MEDFERMDMACLLLRVALGKFEEFRGLNEEEIEAKAKEDNLLQMIEDSIESLKLVTEAFEEMRDELRQELTGE